MGRPGMNRAGVIASAADLADELGFDAVTVSVLARRLGVKTPTLYSHISGGADLRTAIAAYALHELADAVEGAVAAHEGRGVLHAYAGTIRDFARRCPGRYEATTRPGVPKTSGSGDDEAPTGAVGEAIAAGRRNADLVRKVVGRYGIDEARETHAVRLMASVIHGYVSLELAGNFTHSPPPSDVTWLEVLDDLDRTLAALAAPMHA